jgi:hypothetical protein
MKYNVVVHAGYEVSYNKNEINKLLKAVYNTHEPVMRAKYLFRLNVMDTIIIKYFGKKPFAE